VLRSGGGRIYPRGKLQGTRGSACVVSQTATLGLRRLVLRLLASETSSFAKDARPRRHVLLSISITRPGSRLRLASVSPVAQVHHLHSPSLRLPHRRHSPSSTATHGPISRLPLHDPFLPPSSPSGDAAVDAHSHSALTSAKRNLRYLYSPTSSTAQPARFRTRALLRTLRFTLIFIFWCLVCYAKYVFRGPIARLGMTQSATALGGIPMRTRYGCYGRSQPCEPPGQLSPLQGILSLQRSSWT
jgi:hypothetical protein